MTNPSVFSGTAGSAIPVAADEVTIYGGVAELQGVKVHDGTQGGTVGAKVTTDGLYVFHTNQGTVVGTVVVGSGAVAVTQTTSPWVTSASVTNTGTVTGTVTVANASVAVTQSTSPWVTSQSNQGTVVGTVVVGSGAVAVTQTTSPWVTSATITNTGTVAGTVNIVAQPGVDIGDVTINNSTGGAAVNIQDGGNSITIDGAVSVNTGTVVGTVTATPTGTYTTKETRSTAATPVGVAASTTSGTVLATNANRLGATIWNASTAIMYASLAGTVSNSIGLYSFRLSANDYYETPFQYTGPITANWGAANGSALVTELT